MFRARAFDCFGFFFFFSYSLFLPLSSFPLLLLFFTCTGQRWGRFCFFSFTPPFSPFPLLPQAKKVIFAFPCRLGEFGTPNQSCGKLYFNFPHGSQSLFVFRGSVSGMVFLFVLFSLDTRNMAAGTKEQFYNNVVIPRIISWVSTTTFCNFSGYLVVISLVSSFALLRLLYQPPLT